MTSKKTENLFFVYSFEFLNHYIALQGFSAATKASYRDTLKALRTYLNGKNISIGKFTFEQCTRNFVISFLEWLKNNKNLSNSSIGTRLAAVKSYVRYAAEQDPALQSICLQVESVKPFKAEAKIRALLTPHQIEQLVSATQHNSKGYRNKTIILLLYESACRVSELTQLKVSNVFCDDENPYIVVDGKGKKQRAIAISDDMGKCLRNYIGLFHNKDCPDTELLFYVTIKGQTQALTSRSVQVMLKKYAAQVHEEDPKFPLDIHPHMLRRSRATQLYRDGLALEVVSALLGHNQLETTRIYAIPSTSMMREAIKGSLMDGTDEKPDWMSKEDLLAKYFGL